MNNFTQTKRSYEWVTCTSRPCGRPRKRWEDNVEEDLRRLGRWDDKNWLPTEKHCRQLCPRLKPVTGCFPSGRRKRFTNVKYSIYKCTMK